MQTSIYFLFYLVRRVLYGYDSGHNLVILSPLFSVFSFYIFIIMIKQAFFYTVILTAAGIIFYSGCGPKDDDNPIPDSDISYNAHIQPVFNNHCATAACHGDESRAGGISLTTWANTTADFTVVTPGEPDNSILVWTIDPKFGYPNPMPPWDSNIPPLTAEQIRGIRTWIAEGANPN
ncbi:MAG: c-type cytochrome domain-containing protein [Ignavibacteriaceae bacterium]